MQSQKYIQSDSRVLSKWFQSIHKTTPECPPSEPRVPTKWTHSTPKIQITSVRLYRAKDISDKSPSHRIHSCKVRIEEFCLRKIHTNRHYQLEGSTKVGAKKNANETEEVHGAPVMIQAEDVNIEQAEPSWAQGLESLADWQIWQFRWAG